MEPKFKVGDKVKVIKVDDIPRKYMVGNTYTIRRADPCSRFSSYCHKRFRYSVGEMYIVYEDEIELVKPEFIIKDYSGETYVMNCRTHEESEIFCKYLHSIGKRWHSGDLYITFRDVYNDYKDNTCYAFNDGYYGDMKFYESQGYTILKFEDFDWSDFTMKKEFTKADLKNGDVVKRRNGDIEIVCVDTGTMIRNDGSFNSLSAIKYDLTTIHGKEHDIVAVRRPIDVSDCRFSAFDIGCGMVVYMRKEVEEMTLEEVCKALGKEIKIIKEHK